MIGLGGSPPSIGQQRAEDVPPPCTDLLGVIGAAWHGGGDRWQEGVARAASAAAGADQAGVIAPSVRDHPRGGDVLPVESEAMLAQRLSHGRPCAVWADRSGTTFAAAAIGGSAEDFVWIRRVAPPFAWQEVLALRHVAALAEPLLDLDRQRGQLGLMIEELRHRCGNDLQLTASLLSFHARRATTLEAAAALTTAAEQIRTLCLARRLPEDDLAAALGGFCDALAIQAEPRGIALALSITGDLLPLSKARAGLVLIAINEIVTNALKHAFSGRDYGIVRIAVSTDGDALTIAVDDDGVPLADGEAHPRPGSGLDLIARLLRGGRGGLTLPHGGGSKCFVITMPMR